MKSRDSSWILRFFRWFCDPDLHAYIEGDLLELYEERKQDLGAKKAKRLLFVDVLLLFRPDIIRSFHAGTNLSNSLAMFNNYLKTGWRNFKKYKGHSLTNLFGLSIGFVASLILFLIVRYEHSFDTFHKDSKDIYRVGTLWGEDGESDMIVTPQIPLMVSELPDIIHGSRFRSWEDIFSFDDKFVRSIYHLVDSGFAEIFDFPIMHGSLKEAVSEPNKMAITHDVAMELFGSTDVIGQQLRMVDNNVEMEVAAVLENPQRIRHSSLKS